MDRYFSAQTVRGLGSTEWEVLYLLYDALDQLRKMTLSFSELRYLAVEHTEPQIREAVKSLLDPAANGKPFNTPLIVQIPNLANLPIYRITPEGRDLVMSQQVVTEPR
ncbi:MAG: hypothetical protein ABI670_02030 [Chloroflexota bacterium]